MNSASQAVLGILRRQGRPVITSYDLFLTLRDVFADPSSTVRRKVRAPGRLQYTRLINELYVERYIRPDADIEPPSQLIKTRLFRISDNSDGSAEEIICLLDPFAMISHMSALQIYSLSNRIPVELSISTLRPSVWHSYARAKYISDFTLSSPNTPTPDFDIQPKQIEVPTKVRDRDISAHYTIKPFGYIDVFDSFARVISIGDLFVQTLMDPELCGGLSHVLEIWEDHANSYLEQIVDSFDRYDSAIAKVRAGYIITERLMINNEKVESWKRFAQRGGSRKLDAKAPYRPVYSEEWMISINDR